MELIFYVIGIFTWNFVNADTSESKLAWDDIMAKVAYLKNHSLPYVCPDLILRTREGVLSSPFYPGFYPKHVSCSWHVEGNIGDTITVIFEDINIEESCCCKTKPCCLYNWLKIETPANGTERKLCGKDFNFYRTFVSHTHKMWIKFHISNYVKGGRGFRLHYRINSRTHTNCTADELKCGNNVCIPITAKCNGIPECEDGTDEHNCSSTCSSGYSCKSNLHCYEASRHCDGIVDCADFSDETDCNYCAPNLIRCGPNSTQCYDPLTQHCDRIYHCLNGEDEKDCFNLCPGKIICDSLRGCYLPKHRCDGVAQCEDASDEKKCVADICNYEHGGFLCDNGRCIQQVWTCDHSDDCGDGSDERRCLRNSVLTAAVMGSLICALLLVIAISCICRLHALRMLENRLLSRETPLSRLSQDFIFREPPPSYAVAVESQRHQSLCVENLHYSAPVYHGRQRPRHSRRHRRPPVIHQVQSHAVADRRMHSDAPPAEASVSGNSRGVTPDYRTHQTLTQRPNSKTEELPFNSLQTHSDIPKEAGDKEPCADIEHRAEQRLDSRNEAVYDEPSGVLPCDEHTHSGNTSDHYYCDNDSEPLV